MRTEYKQSGIDRRDERHTKDPSLDQNCLPRHMRKRIKPYKLMCKTTREDGILHFYGRPWSHGHYETIAQAKQAAEQMRTSRMWHAYFIFWIEDKDGDIIGEKWEAESEDKGGHNS